jgi:hypothetical protein
VYLQPGTFSTNYDWAVLMLVDGAWPPSTNNITVVTQWMASEPSDVSRWWTGGNPNPRHINPLNNGLGSGGGAGLGGYSSLPFAAAYAAENLLDGLYPQVESDLRNSDNPGTTAQAIWSSPWSGGHYANPKTPTAWGSAWHFGPVSAIAAPGYLWNP